jgi:hypothetical protein
MLGFSFDFAPNGSWALLAYLKGGFSSRFEFDLSKFGFALGGGYANRELAFFAGAGPFAFHISYEFKR